MLNLITELATLHAQSRALSLGSLHANQYQRPLMLTQSVGPLHSTSTGNLPDSANKCARRDAIHVAAAAFDKSCRTNNTTNIHNAEFDTCDKVNSNFLFPETDAANATSLSP